MKIARIIFDLLKATFDGWNEDKAPRLAAALAYYTAFSIAPLLVIVIAVAGLAFGEEAARGEIVLQIQNQVGADTAELIQTMIESARSESAGILATILGVATIALGAAGFFGQLQDALNTVWEVQPRPGRGIKEIIRERFLSFTMVLGIGFLLLVSLILSAVLASLHNFVTGLLPEAQVITQLLNFLLSFGVITVLFAMIYKVLPDAQIAWKDVWAGAVVTALLFTIGKFALSLYLGNSSVASSYGVAGSFVVMLLWIYYSAQILLFGAEFTRVYAMRYGSRIVPAANAQWVTGEQRAQEGTPREPEPEAVSAAVEVGAQMLPALYEPPKDRVLIVHVSPEEQKAAARRWSAFWAGLAVYNTAIAGLTLILAAVRGRRTREIRQ
jgi:membrane protein